MPKESRATVTFSCSIAVKKRLQQLADLDRRTISNFLSANIPDMLKYIDEQKTTPPEVVPNEE